MRIILFMGNGRFINSLGGAERVACNMANEMVRRGHDVVLVCDDYASGLPAYPLLPEVTLVNLNGTGHRRERIPLRLKICRELGRSLRIGSLFLRAKNATMRIRQKEYHSDWQSLLHENPPDVFVTFFYEDLFFVSDLEELRDVPIIQMLHNPPVEAIPESIRKTGHVFDRCQLVQVLRPEYVKDVKEFSNIPVVVIPNMVEQTDKRIVYGKKSAYRITYIGRLDKVKRLELLIEAFAKIAKDFPNWTLHLFGSEFSPGYFDLLVDLIVDLKMDNRIFWEGPTQTPQKEFLASDLFVLPSRQEGFPLALTEALSIGLPCIGYRGIPGVDGLIQNHVNGLLAESGVDGLANSMRELMSNANLREQYGRAGVESVRQYAPEIVWDTWEKLFQSVCCKGELQGNKGENIQ